MGKGDLRSRRGKIFNGSHGKTRPGRAPKKDASAPAPAAATRATGGRK
jgi:ribosomal small subunit protein bTHX